MRDKKHILILIFVFLNIVFYSGYFLRDLIIDKDEFNKNKFIVEYKNETDTEVEIRYKYVLNYKVNDKNILKDKKRYLLFELNKGKSVVARSYIKENKKILIPEISKTITLKPEEYINYNFDVKINPNFKDIQDNILFETRIIIEELKDNKWQPVYQSVLMERGPYWSLNQGPIELPSD